MLFRGLRIQKERRRRRGRRRHWRLCSRIRERSRPRFDPAALRALPAPRDIGHCPQAGAAPPDVTVSPWRALQSNAAGPFPEQTHSRSQTKIHSPSRPNDFARCFFAPGTAAPEFSRLRLQWKFVRGQFRNPSGFARHSCCWRQIVQPPRIASAKPTPFSMENQSGVTREAAASCGLLPARPPSTHEARSSVQG